MKPVEKFLSKFGTPFVFMTGFLYMLPTYNKFWAAYDEGYILEAAYMVMKGMVPYRDFFILMYPPGQIYVLAALLKIFGMNLLVGRIYTIFLQSVICACVFYIVKKLTSVKYGLIASLICLSALAPKIGPIPSPVWPGVAFSLVTISFILNFIENDKYRYLILSSFFAALTVVFRHEIGFSIFVLGLIAFLMHSLYKFQNEGHNMAKAVKYILRLWVIYAIFPFLFVGIISFLLYKVDALRDAIRSLIIFPIEFCRGASIPFPNFCFDFGMIFHRGCFFIERNQFYIPILLCILTAILISVELISKKKLDKRLISLIVILLLGIFYLPQIITRTDIPHLSSNFAPSAILFGGLFGLKINYGKRFFRIFRSLSILFMSFLMTLFVFKNTEFYFKNVYVRAFIKKTTKPVSFKQGTVYIPDDERDTVTSLIAYIENNTEKDEKIYIGSLRHSVPHFGWNDLIYFLTERMPAVKYYELHPGLQERENIQKEMLSSLRENNTRVLLLKDFKDRKAPLGPLDEYIRGAYRLDRIIEPYHIYVKN